MENKIAHKRSLDGENQSVLLHLTETGDLTEQFAKKANLGDQGKILGLLHDFGKYSNQFQTYIKSAVGDYDQDDENWVDAKNLKGTVDHSTAGAQYLWQWLSVKYQKTGHGELLAQMLAICIASHHSGLIDCISVEGVPSFQNRMNKPDEKSHLTECVDQADKALLETVDNLLNSGFIKQFVYALQLEKWSPSNWTTIEAFRLGMATRFLFSCLIDADRLNSAEFETPERKTARLARHAYYHWQIPIDRLEATLLSFRQDHSVKQSPINTIRNRIADDCLRKATNPQGIYTLTVPTGGGKTLASLRYALHHAQHHQLDRIIYIIPYTSIIEQNAQAIRDVVEQDGDAFDWVLEHHSNLEPEDAWRSKLVSENWDAPIVFTTMVQFLEALFSGGTRSVRRLHQLARSVLIFDEIQTLPINCTHLFCNAINYLSKHANTTAVLCTATQPVLHQLNIPEKGQLTLAANHEIVQNTQQLFSDLSRVTVKNRYKPGGWSGDEITELAIRNYQQQGSCLVIVNTKAWATTLYQSCAQHIEKEAIFHLSTNQCAAHRKNKLREIRKRLDEGLPVFCVSTQLIEAGVDVDFSSVIRFVAGLDSIAQAAGRCNRNGKLKNEAGEPIKGQVDVVNPDKEPIQSLIDIKEGQSISLRIFAESPDEDLLAPELMTRYFDYYFLNRQSDMAYPAVSRQKQAGNLLNWLSTNEGNTGNQNRHSNGSGRLQQGKLPLLQQSFKEAGDAFKAIDSQARPLIVPYGEGVELIAKLCGLAKTFEANEYYAALKATQKYTINVFPNVWKTLLDAGAITETQRGEGVFYLSKQYHSDEYGLANEVVSVFEEMNL